MEAQETPQQRTAGQRSGRSYRASRLPILPDTSQPPQGGRQAVLLGVYSEICTSWRMLTDVRFKLLALVPPVAALGLFTVVTSSGPFAEVGPATRVAAAVFGLLVTSGLFVYDRRNSQLYDDLISRGRRAELELGVDTGIFLGRLGTPPGSLVRHGVATGLVYWTVVVSWALAVPLILTQR